MKTKKIVIGVMATAMLSLSVCSLAPAFAADETVQISVGSQQVEAGGTFTVDVNLADIPAEGIQGAQFSLNFDSTVITIDSVKAGTLTTSVTADPTATVLDQFNTVLDNKDGYVNIMWASSVAEKEYRLNGEGVFCTVTGTIAENAEAGEYKIDIGPTVRETFTNSGVSNEYIDVGYNKNGEKVRYNVETKAGVITVGNSGTGTGTGTGTYLKGDANEDGDVDLADATAIIQSIGNPDKYGLDPQGEKNADVDGNGKVTGEDSLILQRLAAGIITKL